MIEEHMGDWTDIAFGSIYFALGKLADEGFVDMIATERQGRRPSRSIYEITPAGRAEFLNLLRQVWTRPQRQHFILDLGLFFIDSLPREEVADYLAQKLTWLEAVRDHLAGHKDENMARGEVPRVAGAIFDHSLAHLEAELEWTREVLDQVLSGVY